MAAPSCFHSVRLNRLQKTLDKALDCSISAASLVDLRKIIEASDVVKLPASQEQEYEKLCELLLGDPLAQQPQDSLDDLVAQTLQDIRHNIESRFAALCQQHKLDEQFMSLEQRIQAAERARFAQSLQNQSNTSTERTSQQQSNTEQDESQDAVKGHLVPCELVHVERIRTLEQEKQALQQALNEASAKVEAARADKTQKHQNAVAQLDRLDQMINQVNETSAFLKNFGRETSVTNRSSLNMS